MSSVALDILTNRRESQARKSKEHDPKKLPRIRKKLQSCTIHHDSVFKMTWDWFVLCLVLYTAIEIPYATAFPQQSKSQPKKTVWEKIHSGSTKEIVNLLVDLMFIIDILINFRSTYLEVKSEQVISEPKEIAVHYLKTWFVVDFVAAIPFDFFIPQEAEGAASLAGLLKTARLLRLIRVSRKMDRYSEYGIAVIFLLTALFTLIAHWLACAWHVIGEKEMEVPYGWIQKLAAEVGKPINQSVPGSGPGTGTRYITALYFTLTSLTSIGFGNVAPNTDSEKIFSVITMLIGALFYASIFGNLTAIIQRLYSRSARYHSDLRVVKEFISLHNIPAALQGTLKEYFVHEQSATKGDDIESIMYRFPESLQADIRVHLNQNLFDEFEIFHEASEGCLRALSTMFRAELFPQKHFLLKKGDQVTQLYFIISGEVDVVDGKKILMSLGQREVVGCSQASIKKRPGRPIKSSVSLVAKVSSQVHSIPWRDLLSVMKLYPEIRKPILEQMELTCDLASCVRGGSDLTATEDDIDEFYIESLQVAVACDNLIAPPLRRRTHTYSEHSVVPSEISFSMASNRHADVFATDGQQLAKVDRRLSRLEDEVAKVLVLLGNNDHVTSAQSANKSYA